MKKEKIDKFLLQKARQAAEYKIRYMPERGETPSDHVARCWLEAFQEAGMIVKDPIVKGYEDRIQSIKDNAQEIAIETANSTGNPGMSCPRDVINPGLYFGFMIGIQVALDIMEDW